MPLSKIAPVAHSNSGAEFGMRNRIINGAMQVWQRGTSFNVALGASAYTCDRWLLYAAGGACTATQSTDVPSTAFKYSTLCSGIGVDVIQRIESVNCFDLVGQSITVSFWMKQTVGAGANSITVGLQSISSADNWLSTISDFSSVTVTPTGSWAQYTATFTNLPVGVANGLSLSFFPTSIASSSTFYITGVQLEKGSAATPFEWRPYTTELALCQRYYYRLKAGSAYANAGTGRAYSTTNGQAVVALPVSMRAAPVGGYSALSDWNAAGSGSITAMSPAAQFSADFRQMTVDITNTFSNGQTVILNANNTTNAWIAWSAEL